MAHKEVKKCTRCFEIKKLTDFYVCVGSRRGECKQCSIKINAVYQKKRKPWIARLIDGTERRAYMREYYAKNKEKYASYRKTFKGKHPGYDRDYKRKFKSAKMAKSCQVITPGM